MSDPKIISPMLDGFAIGGSLSSHDGVSCYPAMKENSDQKYILKVISIPGSQAQLDALLLTGAYKDPAAALDYFKALADEVVAEAEALKKLYFSVSAAAALLEARSLAELQTMPIP